VATIQSALKSKAASRLPMRKTLGPVQLGQPALDFSQENKPLYRIIDCRVCRHRLQHFDNTISGKWLLHDVIVMQISASRLGQPERFPDLRSHRPLYESSKIVCQGRPETPAFSLQSLALSSGSIPHTKSSVPRTLRHQALSRSCSIHSTRKENLPRTGRLRLTKRSAELHFVGSQPSGSMSKASVSR
jgi:hypothetical protein